MAFDKYDAQQRELHYGPHYYDSLAVAELNPRARKSADDYQESLLKVRSKQVAQCAVQSWRARRLGPDATFPEIERRNINAFTDRRTQNQYERIVRPYKNSRYIVALHGTDPQLLLHDNRKVTAYARVESWRKTNGWGRFLGQQFPMITELESLDGKITGQHAEDVAVVVSAALTESPYNAPAGVCVYEQDTAGIEFFKELGMGVRHLSEVEDLAGSWTVTMTTDPDISRVAFQQALAEQFPILQRSEGC